MTDELVRSWEGANLIVRDAPGSDERIVEGIVAPYGQPAIVQDRPGGPRYREVIARGAFGKVDASKVRLESGANAEPGQLHKGFPLIGRGIEARDTPEGLWMSFRVARTGHGNDAHELARDGVLTDFSIRGDPVDQRKLADGTIERTAIRLGRVALVETGAYRGATLTAVRAATEGDMPDTTAAAATADSDETDEATDEATPTDGRPKRTRVTLDIERSKAEPSPAEILQRAEAVRADLLQLTRSASIRITRPEMVYGPMSDDYFLRDQYLASRGNWEAQQRTQKHAGILQERADVIERNAAWDWTTGALSGGYQLQRAGDVLTSELPGAIPTDFVPGLLTPRIFKGRPMGDFYDRYPIADPRPRTFPKVTTSTVVAVQSAEGAALGSTDFATTAVTVTPLMYGAFTDVSRQSLDAADPAAQAMVLQDLLEAYGQASEAVIKTAVEAGSSASGVAITAATPYAGTLANVINYYTVRFKGATGAFIPSALFPVLGAQGDTTGRPFLPMIGAVNSDGTTLADDTTLALGILTAKGKLSYASTVNVNVFGRPNDFVIFESSIASFSFDQVVGPQAVRVGIWSYLVVGARLGSLKVTAA